MPPCQSQRVKLQFTVGHSVCVVVSSPFLEVMTRSFTVWELLLCFCGALSLTRSRVCLLSATIYQIPKAFSITKHTAAVDMLLLKLRVTWSVSLIHCKVVLWLSWIPNWFAFNMSPSSMCLWTIFRITYSNIRVHSLPVVGKRLISRKFWENVRSLPELGKVIIFASIQGVGKWEIRRQWLIKWVKCTNSLFGRCLRHLFEIPSIPQAFLSFREYINFCKSRGLILSGGLLSTVSSRAWTLASTHRLRFSSHTSCDVKWFSKQPAIALAFFNGWKVRLCICGLAVRVPDCISRGPGSIPGATRVSEK
jgi:hypothetical protein